MLGGPARDGLYSAWCWAGLMGLDFAMHAPAPREERQRSKITFLISIAFKIREMGHMVNLVFDGECLPSQDTSAQGPPGRASHLRAGCPD
jgi:hypothetical protein